VNCDTLAVGWQVSQVLAPLGAPAEMHAPPMAQKPGRSAGSEQVPVPGLQAPAAWHESGAAHTTGFDPVHVPLWHESVWVQASPSLQLVPFAAAGFEHSPLEGAQVPATWHESDAVHVTVLPAVQTPALQASFRSQRLPSLHVVPSLAVGFEHWPVEVLQVPAAWHWSDAVHVTGLEPTHAPLWHESVCVQAFPSLHVVPFAAGACAHVPSALQVSFVHGLPSLQEAAVHVTHSLPALVTASSKWTRVLSLDEKPFDWTDP
jgi:hypothetical protein